ncbi:MAG: 6-carboxytetrahydropterin synthase QueD [Spirochaetes bacterium]|nr:6-carboxytetrahydropterin synthase QueD [Spirochaetota bacterium]MBX3724237.1 6-carboxytetrahydropterin synthase QueD [Turneriella sp.]
MLIEKEFVFDSAHFLPFVAQDHKCRRLHGHTYRVVIGVEGDVGETGWIMDFADISAAVQPILQTIDHTLLNAVDGLDNPTAENIAVWIFSRVKEVVPLLSFVSVQEGLSSRVIYPRKL